MSVSLITLALSPYYPLPLGEGEGEGCYARMINPHLYPLPQGEEEERRK